MVGKGDLFCRACGTSLRKNQSPSDFEVGKVAALDTIKSDFLKWIGGISLVLTILGVFSVSKIIDTSVTDKVVVAMDKLQGKIEKKESELLSLIDQAKSDTKKFENQRRELDREISLLVSEKNKIEQTIKDSSFVLIFDKLRRDLFRIKSFAVRVDVTSGFCDPLDFQNWPEKFARNIGLYLSFSKGLTLGHSAEDFAYSGRTTSPAQATVNINDACAVTYILEADRNDVGGSTLLNHPVEDVSQLGEITIHLVNLNNEEIFKKYLDSVNGIELKYFINDLEIDGLSAEIEQTQVATSSSESFYGPIFFGHVFPLLSGSEIREAYELSLSKGLGSARVGPANLRKLSPPT